MIVEQALNMQTSTLLERCGFTNSCRERDPPDGRFDQLGLSEYCEQQLLGFDSWRPSTRLTNCFLPFNVREQQSVALQVTVPDSVHVAELLGSQAISHRRRHIRSKQQPRLFRPLGLVDEGR